MTRLVSITAGFVCLILGIVVIAGWHARIDAVVQLHPSWVPMQYNTALGFVLCGLGILSCQGRRGLIARFLGGFVVALGVLTLAEYAFGIALYIDEFFFTHHISVRTSHPGRMSPNSALCFTLSGGAIYLLSGGRPSPVPCLLVAPVIGLGLIALLGYSVGVDTWYLWGITGMAAHTSIGFIIAGSGIVALWLRLAATERGRARVRFIKAMGVWITLVVVSVSASQGMLAHEKNVLSSLAESQTRVHSDVLSFAISERFAVLDRMRGRAERGAYASREPWETEASELISETPGLLALAWRRAEDGTIWRVSQREGVLSESGGIAAEHPGTMLEREVGVSGGHGTIVGLFDASVLVGDVLRLLSPVYAVEVRSSGRELFTRGEPLAWAVDSTHPGTLEVEETGWTVRVMPTAALAGNHRTMIPWIILISGVFVAFGLAGAVYTGELASERSQTLSEQNERLRAETAERRRADEHIRLIVNAAPVGILMIDDTGMITMANPELERTFGYERGELLGRSVDSLVPTGPRGAHARHRKAFLAAPSSRRMGGERDLVGRRKDGSEVPVDIGLNPLSTASGQAVLATVVDITEQRRTQAELEGLNAILEQKNEELEQFVYTASHDLKSPIVTILGYVSYMIKDIEAGATDELSDQAMRIKRAADRMRANVDDLLELSRVGRAGHQPEPVRFEEALSDTLDLLRGDIDSAGVTVRREIGADTVYADRHALVQVLENYIKNAIRYGCVGGADQVTVGTRQSDTDIHIFVRDEGPGIAPEYHDRVFGLFQRLESDKQGSGVGLALVRRIAELHGGRAWVESTPGEGAMFLASFPGERQASGETGVKHERSIVQAGSIPAHRG